MTPKPVRQTPKPGGRNPALSAAVIGRMPAGRSWSYRLLSKRRPIPAMRIDSPYLPRGACGPHQLLPIAAASIAGHKADFSDPY